MICRKKYQQIERDKVQHLRDREKRTNRERALLLSKQTAQRQKYVKRCRIVVVPPPSPNVGPFLIIILF